MLNHPHNDQERTKTLVFWREKRHILKSQVVAGKNSQQIICINFSNEKSHYLGISQGSNIHFKPETKIFADTGY